MSQQDTPQETQLDRGDAAGRVTLETLNRYLAEAAEDREAAEERSAQVIERFSKLSIAMMCVTMVIAGANVAMLVHTSTAARPVVVTPLPSTPAVLPAPVAPAPPRPVEAASALEPISPQVTPAPAPMESRESARPAEKIPLLGTPSTTRRRPIPAAIRPRMVRAVAPVPRPQPLLSVRNVDDDPSESAPVERW